MMKWLAQLLLVLSIPFTASAAEPLGITTTTLPSGYVGTPYNASMQISGGIAPFIYSYTGLPAGLSQGTTGSIIDTPSAAGLYDLSFSVTDSSSPTPVTVSQTVSLRIWPAVTITTETIMGGTQKAAYSATLNGTGGAEPYIWSIASGTLPQGVILDGVTGAIAGTPSNCGAFPFTARLADSAATPKTVDKSLSISITCSNAYLLTGNAGVAGATVSYSGPANGSVTADANGNYSIGPLQNGGYRIAPSKPLTTFTPISRFVTVSDLDVSVLPFLPALDTIAPTVTAFTAPATATSLTVPVSSLSGTDNAAITGYLITETDSTPSASVAGWSTAIPTGYTFAAVLPDGVATVKTIYAWLKDATGNVSELSEKSSATTSITPNDVTKPEITDFTVAETASTLIVPVATLAATDNVAVTGYLLTESAVAPAPSASGWSATAPTSYTVSATIPAGVPTAQTIYAWSRDAAGNVALSATAITSITITDVTKPVISAFTMPSTAATLNAPVSELSATDNDVVIAGYLITENAIAPSASAVGWGATPPATYSFGAQGSYTVYAWAKDASGNVSESATATITITDVTKPVIGTFTMPSTAASLTVPVTELAATDNEAVAGYLITETATAPSAAVGWSANAPTSYTFSTPGSRTAYAWVKDAAGNVSQGRTATVSITLGGEAACGSSSGKNLAGAPVTGLCASGTATTVVGSGPWSWSCTGADGGAAANCSAWKPADCDTNGAVTISEVQTAINMYLGLKFAELCVNLDGSAGVSISEVQKAINGFLGL